MNEENRLQYIVRVIELRADGEWPVATARVAVNGRVHFTGAVGRSFSALYNVIQCVVKLLVSENLCEALEMGGRIRQQIKVAETGGDKSL